jgi:hypothetical protein
MISSSSSLAAPLPLSTPRRPGVQALSNPATSSCADALALQEGPMNRSNWLGLPEHELLADGEPRGASASETFRRFTRTMSQKVRAPSCAGARTPQRSLPPACRPGSALSTGMPPHAAAGGQVQRRRAALRGVRRCGWRVLAPSAQPSMRACWRPCTPLHTRRQPERAAGPRSLAHTPPSPAPGPHARRSSQTPSSTGCYWRCPSRSSPTGRTGATRPSSCSA